MNVNLVDYLNLKMLVLTLLQILPWLTFAASSLHKRKKSFLI